MKPLLTLLLITAFTIAKAGDPISIKINKLNFSPGDTLSFSCTVANYKELGLENATMNIWIEDVHKTHTWKFRYPMINGELQKTKLKISDSLKPGTYAINFIIQKGLLSVYGKVRDNKHTSLNYFVLTKDGKSHLNNFTVKKDGEFLIPNLVFDNEASVMISPTKAKRDNDLFIDIITPLDSAFIPEAILTQLITVHGNTVQEKTEVVYEFSWDESQEIGGLPNVTVSAKQKKKSQQFNEEYTSPFFRQDDNQARWFDGFEDPQLSRTANLVNFLISRVPSFRREMDFDTHAFTHYLRTDAAVIYFNEMPLPSEFDINSIIPSDIALIKVINAPTMLNRMGNGAAILIYTKRGNYYSDPNVKHNFVLKGYTPQVGDWK